MNELITEKPAQIKRKEDVWMLHVVELGSRVWGFPPPGGDCDVRLLS